jgi:hypothetical protein
MNILPVCFLTLLSPSDGTLKGARVKNHNPLGKQKIVSLMFEKEYAHWEPSGKPKISKPNIIFYSIAVTWLKYC